MFQVSYFVFHWLNPFLVPFCFVLAWGLTIIALLGVFRAVRDAIATSQKMHAIPCTNCRFFTNNHRLKCTVQPFIANTEQAIQCREFEINSHSLSSSYFDN